MQTHIRIPRLSPSVFSALAVATLIVGGFFVAQSVQAATLGDVVITEFMANPALVDDNNGEWIELRNMTASSVDLNGWKISNGSPHTISSSFVIAPGGYAVICTDINTLTNGGVKCDYLWSGMALVNTGDTILLQDAADTTIDTVTYIESDIASGASTKVASGPVFSLESVNTFGAGDFGTPSNNKVTIGTRSYPSIQAAVDVAQPGDTVMVAGGTYDEQIVVDGKNITLQGAGSSTIIKPSSADKLTEFYTTGTQAGAFFNNMFIASIVMVSGGGTQGVTVRDLTVDGENITALPVGAQWVSGITFGETGGVIDNVVVEDTRNVSPSSVRTYSLWLDAVGTASASVDVTDSIFRYYGRNGINARGNDITVNISNNSIIGPGTVGPAQVPNGILLIAGAGGTVSNNTISANHYTGDSFLGSGILLYQARNGITLSGNHIFDTDDAILLNATHSALVQNNNVHDNVKGVRIEAGSASNNTILNNVFDSHIYGIDMSDTAGSGNIATNNSFISNSTANVNNLHAVNSINVENNWWGVSNPPASSFVGLVDYTPWLDGPGGNQRTFNTFVDLDGDSTFDEGTETSFLTIADAITAASSGNGVIVFGGTYNETLTIDKSLTLRGFLDGDGDPFTTITGEMTISSGNVALNSIKIDRQGAGGGLQLTGTVLNSISLDNVTITGALANSVSAPFTGLRVGSGTTVDGLTVSNSHFDGNDIGWYIAKETSDSASAMFTNVNVTNTTFNNNLMKGVYAEKLGNAVFDNITVTNSGISSIYGFNAGIDINLKWGDYNTIEIRNSTLTGSGLMGTASNPLFPVGITLKARGTGTDSGYSAVPSSLTGVTLNNVVVSGGVVGVRLGEPGKSNTGPTNVVITGSSLTGTGGFSLANESTASITGDNNWWGTASPSFGSLVSGGSVSHDVWYINPGRTVLSNAVSGGSATVPSGNFELVAETAGETNLPDGVTTLIFPSGGNLDLSAATETTASASYSNGNLSGVNLTLPQMVGGVSVTVGETVNLESGTDGAPIVLENSSLNDVSLSIPDDTTVLAPAAWDGTIAPPTTASGTGDAPSGFSVGDTVIEVGSSVGVLLFDKPVTVLLEGVMGAVAYRPSGSTTWTEITTTCTGSFSAPDAPVFPGECKTSNGTDTKIYTYHLTAFASLTSSSASTTSSGGAVYGPGYGPDGSISVPTPAPEPTPVPSASPSPQEESDVIAQVSRTPAPRPGTPAQNQTIIAQASSTASPIPSSSVSPSPTVSGLVPLPSDNNDQQATLLASIGDILELGTDKIWVAGLVLVALIYIFYRLLRRPRKPTVSETEL